MQTTVMRPATTADLATVEALLESFDLPTAGVAEHLTEFVVSEDDGSIVASAGLELYGTSALLRSVAVRTDYQGRGLATTLVEHLRDRAGRAGVRDIYLLTSTAAAYFARLGFVAIPDSAIDPVVRASAEFESCCCAGAQAMHLSMPELEHTWKT